MDFGICHLCVIPVRREPSDKSEMISQFLFGETYTVIQKNGNWVMVKAYDDDYEGWIDLKQHNSILKKDFEKINASQKHIVFELTHSANISDQKQVILLGSHLPFFDGMIFKMNKKKCVYNGRAITPEFERNHPHIIKIAKKYLNTPYMWGGRSPFGIDCSGFTQLVYKFVNIPLKRDSYQQAQQGKTINMITEGKAGDLAFFEQTAGKISHVGILLNQDEIIHASGKVRIDKIDNYGIYNNDEKKYTHQLKTIKRLL